MHPAGTMHPRATSATTPPASSGSSRPTSRLVQFCCVSVLVGCSATTTVELLPQNAAGTNAGQAGAGGAGPTAGSAGQAGAAGGGNASGVHIAVNGPQLLHRYDFGGVGTQVVDSVNASNGEVLGGAALDGSGQLSLSGTSSEYVKLPSWLISSLSSVSLVTWVTWHGGSPWQSLFSFGATDKGTPSDAVIAQFFFTPMTGNGGGAELHVETTSSDREAAFVVSRNALPVDVQAMVSAVFDGDRQELRLYINREAVGEPKTTAQRLTELKDANCWLGQSQRMREAGRDDNFHGSYDEFRIYAGALSAEQIRGLSLTDPNLL